MAGSSFVIWCDVFTVVVVIKYPWRLTLVGIFLQTWTRNSHRVLYRRTPYLKGTPVDRDL
jgi:hypothetical protein